MIKSLKYLIFLPIWLISVSHAVIENVEFDSIQQEQDYNQLINEIRCLVCQNQSLSDSNADLAKDLRHKTLSLLKSGKSKPEIRDYMTQRYGEFILYRPPLNSSTFLLWLGPIIVLIIIISMLIVRFRHTSNKETDRYSDEELRRAKQLLKNKHNS